MYNLSVQNSFKIRENVPLKSVWDHTKDIYIKEKTGFPRGRMRGEITVSKDEIRDLTTA